MRKSPDFRGGLMFRDILFSVKGRILFRQRTYSFP
nr:MAG TPA: hypothetical protein [Caudoviricetes sp.]